MAFWDGTRWLEDEPTPAPAPPRGRGRFGVAAQAVLMSALVLTLTAGGVLAAKGGAKGAGSSIELVFAGVGLAATEATGPSHGDTVTFNVSTTATDRPYVLLNCYQQDVWVYAAQAGFWPDSLSGQDFTLAANSWTGGAASCTARLGMLNADGTRFRELASTSFEVSE